jgi:glutamyl-tRNA reductase
MHILVVGLNHQTSPVAVRERLAFRPSQLESAYRVLLQGRDAPLREAAILSTCNRVEVYGVADDAYIAGEAVREFLHTFHQLPPYSCDDVLYTHLDMAAVRHLFGTASGINSLVVGESQIQRQVREAAARAAEHGVLGPVLNTLVQRALETSKRVRTETSIALHAASISQAGVELARSVFGSLQSAHVLLVGSGKVSELAAKNLLDNGAGTITLVNRTVEHAQALADQWGGQALPFEELQSAINVADVVISSTSAPHTVIHAQHAITAHASRAGRPLILIDLAVPRDIDTDVAAVPGTNVYDIDDLQRVVAGNLERRSGEIEAAQAIVDEETTAFMRWLGARTVVPTLNGLRAHAERIRRDETAKALRRMGPLSEREQQIIEALSQGIVNKLLHQPTVRLKAQAAEGTALPYASALQELFGLEAPNA